MIVHPHPKLNIGLDILRRREDGFHDLESLFVPYKGISDVLEIEEAPRFSVEIRRYAVVAGRRQEVEVDWDPRTDLTVRAYQLLKKDFQLPPVSIRLEKNIPVGAGLGGGSADAVFTLRALSEMFDLFIPDVMLEIYAAQLGSDCPFFVYDSPMFVSGRGDNMEEYSAPALDAFRVELLVPEGISVSTREAYAGIVPEQPEIPLKERLALPVEEWKGVVVNVFEKSVFASHPELAELKQSLYDKGAVYASMSGSGSALFGLFAK